MSDNRPFYAPNRKPAAPQQPKPGELLFSFRRRDGVTIACELRFHGESYGWEAMFLRDGELVYSRGAFTTAGTRDPVGN